MPERPFEVVLRAATAKTGADPKIIKGWSRFPHPCSPEGDKDKRSFGAMEGKDGTVLIVSHKPSYSKEDTLRALGLDWKDLFPDDPRDLGKFSGKRIVAGYEYHQITGAPAGRVSRTEDKQFPQGHYTPAGQYKAGLNGMPLPLYLLPMVRDAVAEGLTIHIVEGEKDARNMWRAGYAATTKPGGAQSPWLEEYSEILRGADVVIVADKDTGGRECARRIAQALEGIAKSVRLVEAKEGKDATDHLNAGFTPADFVPRDDLLSEDPEDVEDMDFEVFESEDFEAAIVSYLWEPYLPKGKMILFDADGGTGKSSWVLALAAELSQGLLPNGAGTCKPVKTLYMGWGEDESKELETVYRANGGVPGMIVYHQKPFPLNEENLKKLEAMIRKHGFGLVIFDALFYFLHGLVRDTKDAMEVMPHLSRMGKAAQRTSAVFINIRHTTKGTVDKDAHQLGMGSVQFRNSHRGQLVAQWSRKAKGLVIVTDEKGSILNPRGEPFAFKRIGLQVEYVQGFEMNDNEYVSKPKGKKLDSCKDAIHLYFGEAKIAMAADITDSLKAQGFSDGTITAACKALGIDSNKRGYTDAKYRWHWPTDEEEYDPYADSEFSSPEVSKGVEN